MSHTIHYVNFDFTYRLGTVLDLHVSRHGSNLRHSAVADHGTGDAIDSLWVSKKMSYNLLSILEQTKNMKVGDRLRIAFIYAFEMSEDGETLKIVTFKPDEVFKMDE